MSSASPNNHSSSRKHRTRARWQKILQQFAESGLSAPAFCNKNHLSYSSFSKWRQHLRSEGPLPAQSAGLPLPAFIEVNNAGGVDSAHAERWHIVLKLGGGVELCLSQR